MVNHILTHSDEGYALISDVHVIIDSRHHLIGITKDGRAFITATAAMTSATGAGRETQVQAVVGDTVTMAGRTFWIESVQELAGRVGLDFTVALRESVKDHSVVSGHRFNVGAEVTLTKRGSTQGVPVTIVRLDRNSTYRVRFENGATVTAHEDEVK